MPKVNLAIFHPCENDQPSRVSNYTQYFKQIVIECFDFGDGFRCSIVQKFEKLNNLSFEIFELIFYHDQIKRLHYLIRTEISENESDRVTDILLYKNH